MEQNINGFKLSLSGFFAALTALWGWFGWLVAAWVFMMALDYFTGSAAACKAGEWSSRAAREGLWHKLGAAVAVLVTGLLDYVVGVLVNHLPGLALPIPYTVLLCPLVVTWYILTEMGSVIENAGKLGAPLPGWLKKAVKALRDSVDKAGDGESA